VTNDLTFFLCSNETVRIFHRPLHNVDRPSGVNVRKSLSRVHFMLV